MDRVERLSEWQATVIRCWWRDGEGEDKIARTLHCTVAQVQGVVRRHTHAKVKTVFHDYPFRRV